MITPSKNKSLYAFLFGSFILFMALMACSNSEMIPIEQPPPEYPKDSSVINIYSLKGMVPIFADGKETFLGTNNNSAASIARPQMKIKFTYDFFIGQHEVTCEEYRQFHSIICREPQKPIVSKNYFDAVLYANARSKAENFDTAYTYSSAEFDDAGNCTHLIGLIFHPEKNAYRLPTEAEWVFAAKQNWNPSNGWNLSNSESILHDVCTAKDVSQDTSLCDMAGNALEWVNDWLGMFEDTTITNFVGAPDGERFAQRIIKGGSFRHSAEATQIYNRGDVYAITSSTRENSIGFRLAFGAIPNAIWMRSNGAVSSSRITTHATSTTIHKFTGTYKTKLAFRNDLTGNLVYIDYFNGITNVVEIPDKIDSYHPDISPDGKRIAFCTGLEGINSPSSIYVRDLNATGSNLIKLNVKNASIPRWKITPSGDTTIIYVTNARNNKNEADFKNESTWQVPFADGKFGTPQKLFDGSYHGGISIDEKLAVTGSQLLRARIGNKDTIWYNGEQACNVSLANDQTKRTLFLDFGSKTGRDFVQKNYQTHKQILIADSIGNLIQNIEAPDGYEFDHTEWAKQTLIKKGNLIVASLNNADGAHKKIVLIDLKTESIIPLAEGDELWHPCLWISELPNLSNNPNLDYDSAGVYLTENQNSNGSFYRVKMELLWKNIKDTEVFLFGSSRVEQGLSASLFPQKKMLNMGVHGIDLKRDKFFIENYVFKTAKKLKAVVISLDLDHWGIEEGLLFSILNSGPGYYYDANHNFWSDSIPEGFIEAVENAFPAEISISENYTAKGDFCVDSKGWTNGNIEFARDTLFKEEQQINHDINRFTMKELIENANKHKIHLIGIIFPQAPQYKNTGGFGRYGMKRSIVEKDIKWLDSLSKENPYFIVMDENKMGDHDYTNNMAQDQDHLSCAGTKILTQRLVNLLDSLYEK